VQLILRYDPVQAKDVDGPTARLVAAECGYKEILKEMWGWGTEVQLDLKDDLLLFKSHRWTNCSIVWLQRDCREAVGLG
jgi:hypothetical protein